MTIKKNSCQKHTDLCPFSISIFCLIILQQHLHAAIHTGIVAQPCQREFGISAGGKCMCQKMLLDTIRQHLAAIIISIIIASGNTSVN